MIRMRIDKKYIFTLSNRQMQLIIYKFFFRIKPMVSYYFYNLKNFINIIQNNSSLFLIYFYTVEHYIELLIYVKYNDASKLTKNTRYYILFSYIYTYLLLSKLRNL